VGSMDGLRLQSAGGIDRQLACPSGQPSRMARAPAPSGQPFAFIFDQFGDREAVMGFDERQIGEMHTASAARAARRTVQPRTAGLSRLDIGRKSCACAVGTALTALPCFAVSESANQAPRPSAPEAIGCVQGAGRHRDSSRSRSGRSRSRKIIAHLSVGIGDDVLVVLRAIQASGRIGRHILENRPARIFAEHAAESRDHLAVLRQV